MNYETVDPTGARELLEADENVVYVDVRTVEEFDQGHVPGAYNVPIAFRSMMGMEPNPAFEAVIQRLFSKDQRIVFG